MPNVAQALSFGPDSTKLFGRLNQLVNLTSLVDSICIKTVVYVTTNKWLYCMTHYLFYVFFSILTYIEDITCPCVDITFIFECSTPLVCYTHSSSENGKIYLVTITTVISARVKITCYFHVWRYEVFTRKLPWYFTGVYIISTYISNFTAAWLVQLAER